VLFWFRQQHHALESERDHPDVVGIDEGRAQELAAGRDLLACKFHPAVGLAKYRDLVAVGCEIHALAGKRIRVERLARIERTAQLKEVGDIAGLIDSEPPVVNAFGSSKPNWSSSNQQVRLLARRSVSRKKAGASGMHSRRCALRRASRGSTWRLGALKPSRGEMGLSNPSPIGCRIHARWRRWACRSRPGPGPGMKTPAASMAKLGTRTAQTALPFVAPAIASASAPHLE